MGTKKKIFGLALILTLACFSFFGLKNIIASKADEPEEALARLIYANALDEAGYPTDDTEYNFNGGEGFSPYAVYVTNTVASGSAITLNASKFNNESGVSELGEAEFTQIRIWNNNCQVIVETDLGYVDKSKLVMTGDESWLDVGWSHLNRGGCEANIYTGEDDAAKIAEYFNSFDRDYWNDETVTIMADEEAIETNPEDPHYGKQVITVTWYMDITNLIMGDNVVLFIQDDSFIDEETNEEITNFGCLKVDGSITIGEGSYIEAINEAPRLDIRNPEAEIDGMSLYEYNEEENANVEITSNNKSGMYYFIVENIDGIDTMKWVRLPDTPIGNPKVVDAAKKYIYAYCNLDFDGNGQFDGNDLSFALASELLVKFRDFYGPFGLHDNYEGAQEEVWDKVFNDALIFRDRISIDPNYEYITALDADGNEEQFARYTATVNWGVTEDGEEIIGDVYLYQLNIPEQLLVCTDFDESIGTADTFFVRQAYADKHILVGDVTEDWANVDEDYVASVIVTDKIGKVVAGGHGVSLYEKNVDDNLYTFQTVSYSLMKAYDIDNDVWDELRFDTMVKIFTPAGKYFVTATEGEAKKYDFVSGANGNASDDIWEADGEAPVKLFIHDNILHIKSLNTESGFASNIKEIRLENENYSRGVSIDNTNPDDIVIKFNSDFYDTVTFVMVYDDGTTSTFTVEREGIIIQYSGLNGSGNGRYWLDIYGEGPGNEFNYTYDPDTEKFVVMASYYHSSAQTGIENLSLIITYDDDNTTEVISSIDTDHNFSGYKSGESYGAVDTTSFIIGFMDVSTGEFEFEKNGHKGGFSVQVVNAGYDDANSFGGALLGSGKGKHWDGHANITY